MYPYGPQQEDNEFGLDDFPYYYSDLCLRINTDWTGIPFFSERLYKLYVSKKCNWDIIIDYFIKKKILDRWAQGTDVF